MSVMVPKCLYNIGKPPTESNISGVGEQRCVHVRLLDDASLSHCSLLVASGQGAESWRINQEGALSWRCTAKQMTVPSPIVICVSLSMGMLRIQGGTVLWQY